MKVVNITRDALLADKASLASTFLKRLIGLLNRSSLNKGEALILQPSNSIHSFFMRFSIDVIFLDKHKRVIKTISPFEPYHLTKVYFNAVFTIELPVGIIETTATKEGDIISIVN